jgi:hypothetical protein
MRCSIKQVRPSDEVWLVRFSKKKAVWGIEARAKPFVTRATAEACVDQLTKLSVQNLHIVFATQVSIEALQLASNGSDGSRP